MSTDSAISAGEPAGPRDSLVARAPFYYGWAMLVQAMLAHILTAPGQTVGISVFTTSLTGTLQISESQLTGVYGLGTILACLPLALVGSLMDRYGIRRSLAVTVVLFGSACIFMSWVQSLAALLIAFFLLRFLGQGAMSLLAANTPAMWFHRKLGMVSGMVNVGVVLALGQAPLFIRSLINQFGWRATYVLLGVMVWLILLPVLFVFFRDRPEDVGLRTDGDAAPGEHPRPLAEHSQWLDMNLAQAVRTRSYWLMVAIYTAWAMIGTGLVFNVHKLFETRHLAASQADLALTFFFTAMAATQLIGGLLADRYRLNWLVGISLAGMAGAMALLMLGPASWGATAYLLFGASQGVLGSSGTTMWVRYFGRAHVGKIRGSVQTAAVAGSAMGPFVMGWCYDSLGSYQWSLAAFLALLTILAPLGLAAVSPVRPVADDPECAHA